MPRSGTTLVEQIVSSHPEVAAGGEIAFWGEQAPGFSMDAPGRINPAWVDEAARGYRKLLTERVAGTIDKVEGKTLYTRSTAASWRSSQDGGDVQMFDANQQIPHVGGSYIEAEDAALGS